MADSTLDELLVSPGVEFPATVAEALALLRAHGDDAKILAGGQSLLVLLRLGLVSPSVLISLRRIPELTSITENPGGGVAIGAMVTQQQLARDTTIRERYPALAEAASVVASPAVRRMGTVGGNLCHADPTGDPPAALIALGAEVEIASSDGPRRLPIESLFSDYMETSLAVDELLIAVHLPALSGRSGSAYFKHRLRGNDTALVGVGIGIELSTGGRICNVVRIGLAGAGITPLRATRAEAILRGNPVDAAVLREAAGTAAAECAPLDDTEGSEWYRREMVKLFVQRAGMAALNRAFG